MKLAVGSIWHQSNVFARAVTGLERFQRSRRMLTNAVVSGAGGLGIDVLATLDAWAAPGGIVSGAAFHALTTELLDRLTANGQPDAMVLALHGAMVAETFPEADAEIARRLRAALGPDRPLVLLLDRRANLTPALAEAARAVLVASSIAPDEIRQRGLDAARIARALAVGGSRVATVVRQVPLLVPLPGQRAGEPGMHALLEAERAVAAAPGVVSAGIAAGFPYVATPAAGMAITVTTDGDPVRAAELADQLAAAAWEHRAALQSRPVNIETAIHAAMTATEGPVVLTDTGDDPGGGASGEGTGLLWGLLDLGARRAVHGMLTDPAAVEQAVSAGTGAEFTLDVGGRGDRRGGYPVELRATVERLIHGPIARAAGGEEIDLGRAVLLRASGRHGGEVAVMVAERPHEIDDPAIFHAFGIDPASQQILALKSSTAYQAALGSREAAVIDVETPGITTPDFGFFDFSRLRRPLYPLDQE